MYLGTVDKYIAREKYWHVTYDDGDEEEFDMEDLNRGIANFLKMNSNSNTLVGGQTIRNAESVHRQQSHMPIIDRRIQGQRRRREREKQTRSIGGKRRTKTRQGSAAQRRGQQQRRHRERRQPATDAAAATNHTRCGRKRKQAAQRHYNKRHRESATRQNAVLPNLPLDNFTSIMQQLQSNPEEFFKDSQRDINKALLLYYLNSGYEQFDQYKEYNIRSSTTPIDRDKIMRDIQSQKLTDKELHELIAAFYARHNFKDASLLSCASCGIRLRQRNEKPACTYIRVDLDHPDLRPLKYTEEQLTDLCIMQGRVPIRIPINDELHTREVHPWRIKSVYESRCNNGTFHLHPELVDTDPTTGKESVLICPTCMKSLANTENPKIPEMSVAAGIDFGYFRRLQLEQPNLDKQMILSRCRLIIATLKIRSNLYGRTGLHRDELLCNAILFRHDAPEKAAELLGSEEMFNVSALKNLMRLYFLDPNGQIDTIFQKAMMRRDIFARPWVICQWINVLQRMHSDYGDLVVPNNDTIMHCINSANNRIAAEATKITSEAAFAVDTAIGSDVAQSQSCEVPFDRDPPHRETPAANSGRHDNQRNPTPPNATDETMQISYVLDNPAAFVEDKGIRNFQILNAIGKATVSDAHNQESRIINQIPPGMEHNDAGSNDQDDDNSCDDNTNWSEFAASLDIGEDDVDPDDEIRKFGCKRYPDKVNEFTSKEYVLTASFPHVFMLGRAYKRAAGKMTHAQMHHLLHQFHMTPSKDRRLLAYLTDCKLRFDAVFGVNAYTESNPKALQVITELINSDIEQQRLQKAIMDPESKLAEDVIRKYTPHFAFSGKDINYGFGQGNKVKAYILETQKRMQSPFCFLTLTTEDVHNPRSIRACIRTVDNKHFPAIFENGCPYGEDGEGFMRHLSNVGEAIGEGQIDFSEKSRAKMAIDDPISMVEETKQMLNDVCSLLLGIPPEDYYAALDSESRRKTRYFKDNKGVFGYCLAYIGVTEDHKKVCYRWCSNYRLPGRQLSSRLAVCLILLSRERSTFICSSLAEYQHTPCNVSPAYLKYANEYQTSLTPCSPPSYQLSTIYLP